MKKTTFLFTFIVFLFCGNAFAEPVPFNRFQGEDAYGTAGYNPDSAGVPSIFQRQLGTSISQALSISHPHIVRHIARPNRSYDLVHIRLKPKGSYSAIYVVERSTQKVMGYHLLENVPIINKQIAQQPTSPIYQIRQLPQNPGYWSHLFPNTLVPAPSVLETYQKFENSWVERYIYWDPYPHEEVGFRFIAMDSYYPQELESFMEKHTRDYLISAIRFHYPNALPNITNEQNGDLEP